MNQRRSQSAIPLESASLARLERGPSLDVVVLVP